jgi:hypothetical protein
VCELKGNGPKEQTASAQNSLGLTVGDISKNGVSDGRQVLPQLVGSARFGPKVECGDPFAVETAGALYRVIPAGSRPVLDSNVDPTGFRNVSNHQCTVPFVYGSVCQLLTEPSGGCGCFRHHQQATGRYVEAVDGPRGCQCIGGV